jgi:NADH dehydrogenase
MKHIVIVGAGFAGMRLVRKLGNRKDVQITLVNPSPQFRYAPAIYRAATGFKTGSAWLPLDWMLLGTKNVAFLEGAADKIDTHTKTIHLSDGRTLSYDDVVIATGSITTYFHISGLDEFSYGVKSSEEIDHFQKHIHDNLVSGKKADLDYIIAGAGPTGIELAGALRSHIRAVAKHHRVPSAHIRIHLVEAGPRILPQMNETASKRAVKRLHKFGVKIHTNTQVRAETEHNLQTSLGTMNTDNVIWTAGTANNPFFANNVDSFKLNERGRVLVNAHLQSSPSIYVCGDNAATPRSGLALVAIWHANYIAKDIVRRLHKKQRKPYKEKTPVQVVPIGEKFAIMQYRNFVISGRLISFVRRAADIIGYSDVLGPVSAFTIWRSSEKQQVPCNICGR